MRRAADAAIVPLVALANDMLTTMYAEPGIGLAAPQIGVSKRFFVYDLGEGEGAHHRRSKRGPMRALTRREVPSNRAVCRARAAITRARMAAEGSSRVSPVRAVTSTGGSSRCRSIRSRRGPESRPR